MKQRHKSTHPSYHHILVAVAGQTPQIITETLYALMVQRRPPAPIREIFIITTARGAETARRVLLDPDHGQFFAFCREYSLDPNSIAFDEQHIITIKKEVVRGPWSVVRGKKTTDHEQRTKDQGPMTNLDDIRTVQDNQALAQQLFGFIKQLTANPDTALHCSIAGGRKTMSAYMALALTLYGRQQDTLSHVLVSEEFESNQKFFFPPRRNEQIAIRRGPELDIVHTKDARIELAEIPFIRLRERLGEWFTALDQTVEEVIRTAQYEIDLTPPVADRLIIDLNRREARFGPTCLPLSGVHLATYAYLAHTKTEHCVRPDLSACGSCTECYQTFPEVDQDRFIRIYRRVYTHTRGQFDERLDKKRQKGKPPLDQENFQSYVSRANRRLDDAQVSPQLRIITTGGYGHTRYGVAIDKTRIEVKNVNRET
jgi:CRISPR-associated protein (TIGR02584 family)